MRPIILAYCILSFLTSKVCSQSTFPLNEVANNDHNYYVFLNATIFVDFQTKIERATLIIKDGKIVDVGQDVKVPDAAIVADMKGRHIYPSFIDAFSDYGIPAIKSDSKKEQNHSSPQPESSKKGSYYWNQAIHPETNVVDLFISDRMKAGELRKHGFGTVLSGYMDGIARGTAAAVLLGDEKENELILSGKVAALFSFNKGSSVQDYPSSLMGSIALLRQMYLDAAWYAKSTSKEYNISLEAFNEQQYLPQIFEVKDKLSALRAAKVGSEFKINYIIKGAGDEYQRIDEIRACGVTGFILPLNFPDAYDVEDPYEAELVEYADMKHWEMAPLNPVAMAQYNFLFAFTTNGLKELSDLKKNISKSIKYGLTEQQALKALTYSPAQMLRIDDRVGSLKKGMLANFIICSGNFFDKNTIIYENWVKGKKYVINDITVEDIRGSYELNVGKYKYRLKIEGELYSPKGRIVIADSLGDDAYIKFNGRTITLSVLMDVDSLRGALRLSGIIQGGNFEGNGWDKNGDWVRWSAVKTEPYILDKEDSDSILSLPSLDDVVFPFTAFGKKKHNESILEKVKNRYDAILIKDVTVWTNEQEGVLKEVDVYITDGRIVRVADNIQPTKGAFAKVIDGKNMHLTPGIIDEHSHIAISGGVNEGSQAITSEVRISDVVNCDDVNIYRQLAGGVVASQLLHGSANPIGGQSAIIKLRWGASPEAMKIAGADGFIKFALGENVKQANWGERFNRRFPQTRMGVEQVYYDAFTRAKQYEANKVKYDNTKGQEIRRDLELEALVEILNKKRFITCHSYVQSEINMLMHVADSMGFKVNTFTHVLEGYKLADKIREHGAGGSTFSDWWAYKYEVYDAIPYNGAIMSKSGIITAFNSDDAEMARRLNQEAAKAVKYGGLSEEDALKLITLNPARLLHLDHRMGSIKPGKDADIVLWSGHPLSVYSRVEKTLVDGMVLYDREEEVALKAEMNKDRNRLISLMIESKKKGERAVKPQRKKHKYYHCDSNESMDVY